VSNVLVNPFAAHYLSAEDDLLLLCARTDVQGVAERIRARARECDWQKFAQSAARHRVVPLVHRALRTLQLSEVPQSLLEMLDAHCVANVSRNLHLTGELKRLLSLLEACGIRALAYKGPLLAVTVYGGIAGREFGDLDILVREPDYAAAQAVLREQAYTAGADWGWESSWHHPLGLVRVDLHRAVTAPAFPLPIDFHRLRSRCRQQSGTLAGIPVPCPVDMLILSCVELAKDAAGESQLRLNKVCDIAELLRARLDIDWREVHEESSRLRCKHVVAFGLLAASTLLDAPTTGSPFTHSRIDGPTLLRHLRSRLFPAPVDASERLTYERFHFRVRERWRDKLYLRYRATRERAAPNAKDFATIALPAPLQFLYYFIRPLRLLRDFARARRKPRGPRDPDSRTPAG
jgi:hypothetical protein